MLLLVVRSGHEIRGVPALLAEAKRAPLGPPLATCGARDERVGLHSCSCDAVIDDFAADRGLSICGTGGCTVRPIGVEMAKLIYAAITSLDGYVEDEEGRFDWAMPDEEVRSFVNDLERPIGIYLYGRRMYETMVSGRPSTEADEPAVFSDYAGIWRATEKIVYSRTLQTVSSARTRIDAVRSRRRSAAQAVLGGRHRNRGAELAGHAIGAGLVDESHLFLCPIVVGGGRAGDNVRAQLELLDERRFRNGVVPSTTA